MAYTYSLAHSFVNFDAALDDIHLPMFGSLAISFQFKLPPGFDSVTTPTAITVDLTDTTGTTITTITSATITDLCANAVMAGITDDSFPLGVFQTREDLFIALQLLGYSANNFQFYQCCTDLPNSVSAAGVTINFSRGIINVEITDNVATNFSTASLVDVDECFKFAINIGATRLLSNPFKRVASKQFLTWTRYSNNEDAYDFYYPIDGIENKLWLPMYTYKQGYPDDRKIYLKSDKSYKLLKSSIEKEYETKVTYLPDKVHERIVVAMAHDYVYFLNATIDNYVFKKDEYQIDWDEDVQVDVATAKFKVEHQFAGRNSNCEQRLPCADQIVPPPCTAVVITTATLPNATANQAYSAYISYTGTPPVTLSGFSGASWLHWAYDTNNRIHLTGTPTGSDVGSTTVSFTLTNCTDQTDAFSAALNVVSGLPTSITCGGSANDSWSSVASHNYGFIHLDITSSNPYKVTINWNAGVRPNRFSVRNDTDSVIVATTGWVGTAAYVGPWGASLSTATTGALNFFPVKGKLYSLQIEAGPGNPAALVTDTWSVSVACTPYIQISGSIHFDCSDEGCSQQGETYMQITFSAPTPVPLTLLFGQVFLSGGVSYRSGDNIMSPIPSGTSPDTYYDYPGRPNGHVLPFQVDIPSGTTTINTLGGDIFLQGFAGDHLFSTWICHHCASPISDIYVKIATAGYIANFTITNPEPTIHNM
jgi:hypothetical protein